MLNPSAVESSTKSVQTPVRRRRPSAEPAYLSRSPTIDVTLEVHGIHPVRARISGDEADPPALVLGGISADRRIRRWWPEITGAEGALSADRFRLLSVDWPEPGENGIATTDDLADLLAAVLDALNVARVEVFVGASFGAMVGLSFAARHSDRIGRLVAISGAHRSTPAATAGRLIQRRIIESLARLGNPAQGVALARSLALTSYRPASLFDQRFFDADPVETLSRIEQYFDHNGTRFSDRFDAGRYLALSSALDRHCVDPTLVRCRAELIGVTSDRLVPVSQLRELAGAIGIRARLHLIDSPFGHDAFLKSTDLLNPLLKSLLNAPGGDDHHE